ncbi:MAG: hypothetical protein ACI9FN_002771 [Saprospiraceae bacterium]|jgi:hypothetical protein
MPIFPLWDGYSQKSRGIISILANLFTIIEVREYPYRDKQNYIGHQGEILCIYS